MKKKVFVLCLILGLTGCAGKKIKNEEVTPTVSPELVQNEEKEYRTIEQETDSSKYDDMTPYQDCFYDVDIDDAEDKVTLYTNAQKDKNGEFMWDDSQNWILAVEGNNGNYTLYDEYTSGKLEMYVTELQTEKSSGVPIKIRLVISSSSGFEIREYSYYDAGKYKETIVYSDTSINELSVNQY